MKFHYDETHKRLVIEVEDSGTVGKSLPVLAEITKVAKLPRGTEIRELVFRFPRRGWGLFPWGK